jgi:hypothetical protein
MDLTTVAAAVLRPGAPTGLRDERIVVSLRLVGSLLDGRASLAEISPDLAREVRAAPADAEATLILPAGPGPARIDLGGRQFVVPGALRDALVAVLAGAVAGRGALAGAPVPAAAASSATSAQLSLATEALVLAASADSPAASSAAANLLAASGALRTARNESVRTPGQTVGFETPVFDPREPAATAERLAARVSDSGTFFEAHVVQWLRGDRSAEAVQREAQQLVPTFSDPARAEARAGVQLDALHRQAIALSGPAWSGQQLLLELARDPQVLPDGANGSAGNADQVYVARLKMELPRLGAIEIRLRLAGESVAASVAGGHAATISELERALPEFASALAARGLRPVLLQTVGAAEQESHQ